MICFKKPRSKTIGAFLKSKGWSLDKTNEAFYFFSPPDDIVFDDEGFRCRVPIHEDAFGYNEVAFTLIQNLSEMYEFKPQELIDILCKTMEEIRHEVEREERLLEMKIEMMNKLELL